MAHTWPKPVRPIRKTDRTCARCGLTASAVKYKRTERVDYGWAIAWGRDGDAASSQAFVNCRPAPSHRRRRLEPPDSAPFRTEDERR